MYLSTIFLMLDHLLIPLNIYCLFYETLYVQISNSTEYLGIPHKRITGNQEIKVNSNKSRIFSWFILSSIIYSGWTTKVREMIANHIFQQAGTDTKPGKSIFVKALSDRLLFTECSQHLKQFEKKRKKTRITNAVQCHCICVGQVMFSHHSDQMSQRSQVNQESNLSDSVSEGQNHILSCSGQLKRCLNVVHIEGGVYNRFMSMDFP